MDRINDLLRLGHVYSTWGIHDSVRPGETGWLAEAGNVHALREAIEQGLGDEMSRQQMGRRAREVVKEEYTLKRQAQRYTDLYKDMLQTNGDT